MKEYPEIEIRQVETAIQQGAGKEYEGQAEEPQKPGEEARIPYTGVSEGEVCKSCLEMPEEQRKTMILEIQQMAEEILRAHKVITEPGDLLKGEWFLKLQKPGLEKKLVLAKYGEEIFIGLYTYSDEIPIPDPNLVLLSQNGFWYPQRIEEKFEETVSSFFTGAYGDYDFLNIVPENLETFQVFQRDFVKTLENQGWSEVPMTKVTGFLNHPSLSVGQVIQAHPLLPRVSVCFDGDAFASVSGTIPDPFREYNCEVVCPVSNLR